MKAVLRVRPGEVAVVERPRPEPGPGEVLVRVRACGICGSDLARLRDPHEKWNRVVLGHECSGLVEAFGPPVRGADGPPLELGQRVALLPLRPDFTCRFCRRGAYSLCDSYGFFGSRQDGGLAEYLLVPAENLLPLPEEVDDETGALLEPLSVATEACLLGGLRAGGEPVMACCPGDGQGADRFLTEAPSVLVMGAGTIGLLAVQVALALGAAPVLACDVLPERLDLAAALGAQPLLGGSGSVAEQVRAQTEGQGVAVCLECSGHHAAFAPVLESLAKGGTVVLVGTGPGEVVLTGKQREQICRRRLTVRGQWMSYRAPWPGAPWTMPLRLLQQGRLDPKRVITHRYSLEEVPAAVRMMLTPGADFLKVMIRPE